MSWCCESSVCRCGGRLMDWSLCFLSTHVGKQLLFTLGIKRKHFCWFIFNRVGGKKRDIGKCCCCWALIDHTGLLTPCGATWNWSGPTLHLLNSTSLFSSCYSPPLVSECVDISPVSLCISVRQIHFWPGVKHPLFSPFLWSMSSLRADETCTLSRTNGPNLQAVMRVSLCLDGADVLCWNLTVNDRCSSLSLSPRRRASAALLLLCDAVSPTLITLIVCVALWP